MIYFIGQRRVVVVVARGGPEGPSKKRQAAQLVTVRRVPVAELVLEQGRSKACCCKCRAKLGGVDASMFSEMKAMEKEN